MKRFVALSVLGLCLAASAFANPTGSPLVTYPVEPCRVFDSRVALGPLSDGHAVSLYVRGGDLPASHGAALPDCGVPASAQAVVVNVIAIYPSGPGYLKVNGAGDLTTATPYARLVFNGGDLIANEMLVSLCNVVTIAPGHTPCPHGTSGRYLDIQIESIGADVDVAVEVVGYLATLEP